MVCVEGVYVMLKLKLRSKRGVLGRLNLFMRNRRRFLRRRAFGVIILRVRIMVLFCKDKVYSGVCMYEREIGEWREMEFYFIQKFTGMI
mmetsp:Transcript_25089/g.33400  ORF Transcript_25089/g.33400 Transcript_25089/m.33400 type:complete len:89 (+) Transcript_25089:1183-1449(+)